MGGWVRTEQEPGEIARVLHDQIVQGIVAALWELNAADGAGDAHKLQAAATSAQTSLERTLDALRELMARLEPAPNDATSSIGIPTND